MKKTIALLLAFVLSCTLFSACNQEKPADTSYIVTSSADGADAVYPTSLYRFFVQWLTDYYYDLASSSATASGGTLNWEPMLAAKFAFTQNKTLSDFIVTTAKDQYMTALYTNATFRDLGLSLTDEEWKSVDKQIQDDWVSVYGNDGFLAICRKLGMTYDEFRDQMASSIKQQKIVDYYYGAGGESEVTEAEKRDYFENNYVRFKYVVLLLQDSDGNELGTEELAEVTETRDLVLSKLDQGASFEDMVREYSYDHVEITDKMTDSEKLAAQRQNETIVEDGLVTDADGIFDQALALYYNMTLDEAVIEKVFSLKEGEYAAVQTEDAIWIVKKYSNTEKESYFENASAAVYQALYADDLSAKHTAWRSRMNFIYNEDAVAEFLPEKLEKLFDFTTSSSSN